MSDVKIPKETFEKLRQEVILAEKINEQELEPKMREGLARYIGRHIPDVQSPWGWDVILNEIYPVVQYEIPSIYFRNPRAYCKARTKTFIAKRRDPNTGQMVEVELDSTKSAKTQEAVLNFKINDIRYKPEVQRTLLDALIFPHGVMWHGYKGSFGMTEEKSLYIEEDDVFVQRINPMRFLKDPSVPIDRLDEAWWVARTIEIPLSDLLEDDTLDVDKNLVNGKLGYGELVGTKDNITTAMNGGDSFRPGSMGTKPLSSFLSRENQSARQFRFVTIYECFVRPTPKQKRNGEKGWLVLYCKEQEKPLRVSKFPYKAKGWPSKILQFNPVCDEPFGMADFEVYGQIADQKNMIVNLQLRNAKENSKVWVGISKEGTNEEDVEKVRVGDQTVIAFEGGNPRDKMFVASAGGSASSELYLIDERIQRNLENASGVTDLRKGFLQSGEESATSAAIRNAGGSVRAQYRQDQMSDYIKDSFDYLLQLIKQYVPVEDAVRIVGSLDAEWSDSFTEDEIQAPTDIEIDVISMLPESPEKEMQENKMMLDMATQALNNPPLMTKLGQEGYMFNVAPIIENLLSRMKIRNPEVFRRIRQDESEGFVKVFDMTQAGENVKAALAGQMPTNMPEMGQDHKARIFLYNEMLQLISELGDSPAAKILNQLIMAHSALAEEEEKKQPKAGRVVGA
jgi:hypothetical protein